MTCLPPPPVAAAASAEPSLLPPPSSRPRRSTSEVQWRLAATPVVARRFGSTQGAPRRPFLPTCPLRHPDAADDHERALAGAQNATRRTVAADNQLDIALASAGHALRAAPPSALTHIRVLCPRARPSHVTLVEVCDQTHEYCELFMIICSLSIQSHDKLGAAVFKLMIIFVCCIQTQLIVFMPNAG